MKKKNKKKGGSNKYITTSNFMTFTFILILCVGVYYLLQKIFKDKDNIESESSDEIFNDKDNIQSMRRAKTPNVPSQCSPTPSSQSPVRTPTPLSQSRGQTPTPCKAFL